MIFFVLGCFREVTCHLTTPLYSWCIYYNSVICLLKNKIITFFCPFILETWKISLSLNSIQFINWIRYCVYLLLVQCHKYLCISKRASVVNSFVDINTSIVNWMEYSTKAKFRGRYTLLGLVQWWLQNTSLKNFPCLRFLFASDRKKSSVKRLTNGRSQGLEPVRISHLNFNSESIHA